MPKADNANYLWIQLFYSSLNAKGRAGFVMANSAADARQSEMEIRKKLLQARAVDVMIAIGPNFFYTVTLPCTLWFFDRGKSEHGPQGQGAVHRRPAHLTTRLTGPTASSCPNRSSSSPTSCGCIGARSRKGPRRQPATCLKEHFNDGKYADVPGLCKVATLDEIEAQGWSLNPGRYVGVAEKGEDDFDFAERLEELNEELEVLNSEARELEERIAANVAKLLGGGYVVRNHWQRVPIKTIYLGLFDGPHATPKPSDVGPCFLGIKNHDRGRPL